MGYFVLAPSANAWSHLVGALEGVRRALADSNIPVSGPPPAAAAAGGGVAEDTGLPFPGGMPSMSAGGGQTDTPTR